MDLMIDKALKAAGLMDYFNSLTPSHKREYLNWISEAKKPETKQQRIFKMIDRLRAK